MGFKPEQLAKAKTAKSVKELLAYANEVGYPLSEAEAEQYYSQWHKEGELADEELDNVAGGSTCINGSHYSDDPPYYLVTTVGNSCPSFVTCIPGVSLSESCFNCKHWTGGTPSYCKIRTKDHDKYNDAIGNGLCED